MSVSSDAAAPLSLEIEFGSDHDSPRQSRLSGNLPEGQGSDAAVRHARVHMIEQVLSFESKLESPRLRAQAHVLHERQIPLAEARSSPVRKRAGNVADL